MRQALDFDEKALFAPSSTLPTLSQLTSPLPLSLTQSIQRSPRARAEATTPAPLTVFHVLDLQQPPATAASRCLVVCELLPAPAPLLSRSPP